MRLKFVKVFVGVLLKESSGEDTLEAAKPPIRHICHISARKA